MNISRSVGAGGVNEPADVIAVKRRLIELGFHWLEESTTVDAATTRAIKLFQAIKNGTHRVSDPRNDGRVDPGGDTLEWLKAANAPRWLEFPAGSRSQGFVNFELSQTSDHHDFGVSWLADTILATGASYKADYMDSHPAAAALTINDISRPEGGDTPHHATHESGLACDVRLPRKDGGSGGITVDSASYDRDAMRAQLRAFRQQGLASRVLLSDPVLVAEGLCTAAAKHQDHAHWEIKPPARE
jgi:hypothetical protein